MRALPACALAAQLLVAGTAAAQTAATDGLGSVTGSDALGERRNIGVAERRHPEWAAEPIRLSGLELMPRISMAAGYDDNLFATRSPIIDDGYVNISPQFTLTRPSPNLRLTLTGNADLIRYFSRPSENVTDYELVAAAQYRISNATRLDVRGSHGRFAEERTSPDSPTGVIRPNRFTLTQAAAILNHRLNRLQLAGTLDAERRDYRDGRNPLGDEVDQDFRDRTTITATGVAEYSLKPGLSLFAAASTNRRDYRPRPGPIPEPVRDSIGYEVAVGTGFELGARIRGAVRAGYLRQDYRDPQFLPISGLLVSGELAYYLTPLITLTGEVSRSVSETGIAGAAGYLRTTASLRADYELLRNLRIGASVELENRDFVDIDRQDDRLAYQATMTYRLSKRIALNASLLHRDQASVGIIPGREFEKTRVSLGVTLAGL